MATRSQLQTIHQLGSNRNATRVLKNLQTYIQHFRENENIYYLNKAGRELVGCEKTITKTPHFHHTIMRNDVYIHFGCPKIWQNEFKIPNPEFTIIPDAVFNSKGTQYFLEVDHMQKMKKNIEKLNKYKRFKDMNLWQKKNMGRFPVVLFYTEKDSRKAQIIQANPGIELLVYTKEDLH
ncbi:MAG: replication-relaxation family protein [Bacillus sp. (in: firmicutes)]